MARCWWGCIRPPAPETSTRSGRVWHFTPVTHCNVSAWHAQERNASVAAAAAVAACHVVASTSSNQLPLRFAPAFRFSCLIVSISITIPAPPSPFIDKGVSLFSFLLALRPPSCPSLRTSLPSFPQPLPPPLQVHLHHHHLSIAVLDTLISEASWTKPTRTRWLPIDSSPISRLVTRSQLVSS